MCASDPTCVRAPHHVHPVCLVSGFCCSVVCATPAAPPPRSHYAGVTHNYVVVLLLVCCLIGNEKFYTLQLSHGRRRSPLRPRC